MYSVYKVSADLTESKLIASGLTSQDSIALWHMELSKISQHYDGLNVTRPSVIIEKEG